MMMKPTPSHPLLRYGELNYSAPQRLITLKWLAESARMTESEFKQLSLLYVDFVEQYRCPNVLIDLRELNYIISPEEQQWSASTVFPRVYKAGQRRVAYIVNTDLVTQLSVEQAMEEREGAWFDTQYFDNIAQAYQWFDMPRMD
jgi:hypothetical protein